MRRTTWRTLLQYVANGQLSKILKHDLSCDGASPPAVLQPPQLAAIQRRLAYVVGVIKECIRQNEMNSVLAWHYTWVKCRYETCGIVMVIQIPETLTFSASQVHMHDLSFVERSHFVSLFVKVSFEYIGSLILYFLIRLSRSLNVDDGNAVLFCLPFNDLIYHLTTWSPI